MSPGSRPIHGTFPERVPATSRIAPRTIMTTPKPTRIFPSSHTHPPLPRLRRAPRLAAGGRRQGAARMGVGDRRGLAPVGAAHEEADLQEEGLHHLRQRLRLVVAGGGGGLGA